MSEQGVHEDTLVAMANGTTLEAKHVTPGDIVATPDGGALTIAHVVKIQCAGKKQQFVVLPGGLRVLPWHPVRPRQDWVVPCDLGFPCKILPCSHIYLFACKWGNLARTPALVGDGTPFVILGHEAALGHRLHHPFFGSISTCIGPLGLCTTHEFSDDPVVRDPVTHAVCAWDLTKRL